MREHVHFALGCDPAFPLPRRKMLLEELLERAQERYKAMGSRLAGKTDQGYMTCWNTVLGVWAFDVPEGAADGAEITHIVHHRNQRKIRVSGIFGIVNTSNEARRRLNAAPCRRSGRAPKRGVFPADWPGTYLYSCNRSECHQRVCGWVGARARVCVHSCAHARVYV